MQWDDSRLPKPRNHAGRRSKTRVFQRRRVARAGQSAPGESRNIVETADAVRRCRPNRSRATPRKFRQSRARRAGLGNRKHGEGAQASLRHGRDREKRRDRNPGRSSRKDRVVVCVPRKARQTCGRIERCKQRLVNCGGRVVSPERRLCEGIVHQFIKGYPHVDGPPLRNCLNCGRPLR